LKARARNTPPFRTPEPLSTVNPRALPNASFALSGGLSLGWHRRTGSYGCWCPCDTLVVSTKSEWLRCSRKDPDQVGYGFQTTVCWRSLGGRCDRRDQPLLDWVVSPLQLWAWSTIVLLQPRGEGVKMMNNPVGWISGWGGGCTRSGLGRWSFDSDLVWCDCGCGDIGGDPVGGGRQWA
jgi:hypothetical protein